MKRHIRKVRKQYQSRRDFTAQEFRRIYNSEVSFEVPAGGLALWVNVTKLKDVKSFKGHNNIDENLCVYYSGENCNGVFIRFGFGALTQSEITASIKALV